MLLSKDEILFILQLIEEKHGRGYSDDPEIARLQTKLSIMLEAKERVSQRGSERMKDDLVASQNIRTVEAGASVVGVKIDRIG